MQMSAEHTHIARNKYEDKESESHKNECSEGIFILIHSQCFRWRGASTIFSNLLSSILREFREFSSEQQEYAKTRRRTFVVPLVLCVVVWYTYFYLIILMVITPHLCLPFTHASYCIVHCKLGHYRNDTTKSEKKIKT